jgi:hypothetical protein
MEKKYEHFKVAFNAIRALMKPPDKKRKKIGFEVKERAAPYGRKKAIGAWHDGPRTMDPQITVTNDPLHRRLLEMPLVICVAVILLFLPAGCVYIPKIAHEPVRTVYVAEQTEATSVGRFAPAFLVYEHFRAHNRIGTPKGRYDEDRNEKIFVDPEDPVFYYMTRSFTTQKGTYTNLVYRIQFPEVPFSLFPFHLTAGKNIGLLIVVTLDLNQRPLLITSVGTCGCYVSIVPTTYLPEEAYPEVWKRDEQQTIYGEKLPSQLDFKGLRNPKLLIHIRPGVHRVMNLEFVEHEQLRSPGLHRIIRAPLREMDELERISVNGERTSFYYSCWPLRGHVKGSMKPWESLFLSLISLDFFVGTDKVYGDSRITGNPFYTSLKPWNREASDMWEFARFLKFYGWRL